MSSEQHHEDELKPEQTAGFKVAEKKTIEEYHKLGEDMLLKESDHQHAYG